MKNYALKAKTDYLKLLEKVENKKLIISGLQKESQAYKNCLRTIINLTLLAKANGFCLDNDLERRKTTKLIINLLNEIGLFE